MKTVVRQLFSVALDHDYADDRATAVDFVVPARTRTDLGRGRLLCKVREGRLHALMATDASGGPLLPLADTVLRFGLRPRSPGAFANVTEAPLADAGADPVGRRTPVYRTTAVADELAPPAAVFVVGHEPRFALNGSDRPATIAVIDAADRVLWQQIVPDATTAVTLDLRRLPPGPYRLRSIAGVATASHDLLLEPELADCFALVEIRLDAAMSARDSSFHVPLAARSEVMRYYVVARNGGAAALAAVNVEDAGHVEDGRPQVSFRRIEATAFTSAHLPATAVAGDGGAVALFESTVSLPRRHPGRRRIQLSRNGDVVIQSLPAAAAERTASDLIVHLPQP